MKRLIKKSEEIPFPKYRFVPLFNSKKTNNEEKEEIELVGQSNRKITFKYNGGNKVFRIPDGVNVNKSSVKFFVNGMFLWDNEILTTINSSRNAIIEFTINFNLQKGDIVEITW